MAAATPFSTSFFQCPGEPTLPFDTWLKWLQPVPMDCRIIGSDLSYYIVWELKDKDCFTPYQIKIKAAGEQARIIAGENSASVQAVSAGATAFSRRRRNSAPPKHVPAPTLSHPPAPAVSVRPVSNRTCFCCGSQKHLANDTSCPAASVKCKNCNKIGHFAQVCRSAQFLCVKSTCLKFRSFTYMNM
ncbi:hypothetical protein GOODEAATRI_002061 [Goodea atripinnis]|uniref:CCHC-type domain-containing protein n=1 Tax=Goodea atripinnis TaxID=208336 RepID=A0ABV0PV09_9TELE